MFLKVIYSLSDSDQLSFLKRGYKIRSYRSAIVEDKKNLCGLSIPDRDLHEGIAGIEQGFGLFVFTWMCLTGLTIFIIEITNVFLFEELIEDLHEFGEVLIPVFILLHVGAVIMHYIKGENLLRKINPF